MDAEESGEEDRSTLLTELWFEFRLDSNFYRISNWYHYRVCNLDVINRQSGMFNVKLACHLNVLYVSSRLMSALTKNEERRAVLRQATIDNSTKQFIEIWDKQHFVKNYDLSALDVHGDVYTDSMFWSFISNFQYFKYILTVCFF